MAAVTAMTPLRDRRLDTKPMRRTLMSRSSLEKPRPFDRFVRTTSPSSSSTRWPILRRRSATGAESVDLPAPDMPVNQSVNPLAMRLLHGQPLCPCQAGEIDHGDAEARRIFLVQTDHGDAETRRRTERSTGPRPGTSVPPKKLFSVTRCLR